MKKVLILGLGLFFLAASSQGQKKKKEDVEAIMSMCGCYDISFNFAETFGASKDYEYHDNYYSGGLEWVFPVEQTKDKIVLQHLLVVNDTMIIKHWRQDWIYENQDLFAYHKDNSWKYQELPATEVKGQWTQKVFQVDDSPRYEGSATWVHVDGRHFWESVADAPLPRREFSKRSDYNVTVRTNRHEITDYGWLHEQDNKKVIRDQDDTLLAREKGWNTYSKIEESKCQPAIDWWMENNQFWADVRAEWAKIFGQKTEVSINMKVDDKLMFMRLFELGSQMSGSAYDQDEARKGIRKILKLHFQDKKLILAKE